MMNPHRLFRPSCAMITKELTPERLRATIHYDPETGVFTRIGHACGRAVIGGILGTRRDDGYMQARVNYRIYLLHRLAWFYMTGVWPSDYVDHINQDRSDNRWSNLRAATHSQNNANSGVSKRNKVGIKGVHVNGNGPRKYTAMINHSGKTNYLGAFSCPAAAHFAYLIAADEQFGAFSRAR